MKQTLRITALLLFACAALATFSNLAQAQKVDLAFGVSTTSAPSASFSEGVETAPSLAGGAFPGVSGDLLFFHHVGFGGEVYWKATQSSNYLGSGYSYRPLFYDFDAVYSPKLASHTYLELAAGIGALSTRFYTGTSCGPYSCSNYQSSNHFMGDFGAGIKIYPKGGFFIRPEARLYLVNNNTSDYSGAVYSSSHVARFGASIGYTFGGR